MRAPSPAVAWTGWNFCNGARGPEGYPSAPAPRLADCVAVSDTHLNAVSEADNALAPGDSIPGVPPPANAEEYARAKERYLGSLCARPSRAPAPAFNYSHWSVMFKNGNFDPGQRLCAHTAEAAAPSAYTGPAAATGSIRGRPMNQPLMVHRWTSRSASWEVCSVRSQGTQTAMVCRQQRGRALAAMRPHLVQIDTTLIVHRLPPRACQTATSTTGRSSCRTAPGSIPSSVLHNSGRVM